MSVKHIMESLDVYRNESDRLSDALKVAYERRDTKAARAILRAAAILIRHLRLGLETKYGTFRKAHSLGAYKFKRPDWMGKTPQEVIDDLYTTANFDKWWEEILSLRAPKEVGE